MYITVKSSKLLDLVGEDIGTTHFSSLPSMVIHVLSKFFCPELVPLSNYKHVKLIKICFVSPLMN